MSVVVGIVQVGLLVFVVLLFGRVTINLISLFSRTWKPRGVTLLLAEVVLSATDPPVRFVRALLPDINLGGVRLDLSVLVLMIVATVAINLLSLAQ
ncbi:MAG: YggT family protein [Demequinaceae bacterium]|nr:YggT family protein [Demequinaceae bacterium]